MKRFNLLLPKNLYGYLEKSSLNSGLTKAQFLRQRIELTLDNGFSQKSKPFKQTWNLHEEISFNFIIETNLYEKIYDAARFYKCTKGELVRFILYTGLVDEEKKESAITKPVRKEFLAIDPIIQNINLLLSGKKFFQLNNYISNFLSNHNENRLVSLGQPQMLINTINILEKNYKDITPGLIVFKAKMLWFLGNSEEALHELNNIEFKYKGNKKLELKAEILKSDILTDFGLISQAQEILETLIKNIPDELSDYYKVKIYNKLGLSMFYTNKLENTKQCYENALRLARKEEEIAIAHRYLASIYYALEMFQDAETHYKLSLEAFEKNNDFNINEYCKLLMTYAKHKLNFADWIGAQTLATKAVAIAEKIHHIPNLSWGLRILSATHFNLGESQKAMELAEQSILIAQKVGGVNLLSKAYRIKGKYLLMQGQFDQANHILDISRLFEKKHVSNINYNTILKWQNYLKVLKGGDVNFDLMHKQSETFKLNSHFKDETANDYVLGHLYLSSNKSEEKDKGEAILKRVHRHSIVTQNKKMQFATESALRFGQFMIV